MAYCVPGPLELDDISSLLSGVDCRVAQYVEAAYAGLFGPFGWLAPTLTAALTIYVAIYAYQVIGGYGSLSLSTVAKRFIAIGVVVAFSSNWAAYQTVFVNLLSGGGEDLASMILRATAGAGATSVDVGARLDMLFDDLTTLASTWGHRTPLPTADAIAAAQAPAVPMRPAPASLTAASAVNMLWFSAIVLALGSAGVLVVAKIVLGFLLALGPLFILLALFPATRGLFEGWLRAAAMNALVPVLALLATAGMLPIVEPIIEGVAADQALGRTDTQPVFVLAITSMIFGVLMVYSVVMTGKLAGAWRLPTAQPKAAASRGESLVAPPAAVAANPRIVEMVAAIGRDAQTSTPVPESWRLRG
ncbi:MAG: type IV secretion system protein, partial [Parvularculaceae bacterium]